MKGDKTLVFLFLRSRWDHGGGDENGGYGTATWEGHVGRIISFGGGVTVALHVSAMLLLCTTIEVPSRFLESF